MWVNNYQLIAVAVLLSLASTELYGNQDEAPSDELLEFLGEFQTQDGEWFDPLNLLDVKQSELQQDEIKHGDTIQTELKRNSEEQSDE